MSCQDAANIPGGGAKACSYGCLGLDVYKRQIKYWTSKNSKHAKVKLLKKNTIVKSTIKGVKKGKKYILIDVYKRQEQK